MRLIALLVVLITSCDAPPQRAARLGDLAQDTVDQAQLIFTSEDLAQFATQQNIDSIMPSSYPVLAQLTADGWSWSELIDQQENPGKFIRNSLNPTKVDTVTVAPLYNEPSWFTRLAQFASGSDTATYKADVGTFTSSLQGDGIEIVRTLGASEVSAMNSQDQPTLTNLPNTLVNLQAGEVHTLLLSNGDTIYSMRVAGAEDAIVLNETPSVHLGVDLFTYEPLVDFIDISDSLHYTESKLSRDGSTAADTLTEFSRFTDSKLSREGLDNQFSSFRGHVRRGGSDTTSTADPSSRSRQLDSLSAAGLNTASVADTDKVRPQAIFPPTGYAMKRDGRVYLAKSSDILRDFITSLKTGKHLSTNQSLAALYEQLPQRGSFYSLVKQDGKWTAMSKYYDGTSLYTTTASIQASSPAQNTDPLTRLSEIGGDDNMLFWNHRTSTWDILSLNGEQTLELYAPSGRQRWTYHADHAIHWPPATMDMFKNGRQQIVFTTEKQLSVLDSRGNLVKPYPLDFKDAVTQPVSVLDYDGKRDYRLMVVQGDAVLAYDAKGKRVRGFAPKMKGLELIERPHHFTIQGRDYISLVGEDKMLLVSRTGELRATLSYSVTGLDQFAVTRNQLVKQRGDKMISIDPKSESLLETEATVAFTAYSDNSIVSVDGEKLTIGDQQINIGFDTWSAVKIWDTNRFDFIELRNEDGLLWLYKMDGSLVKGFPIQAEAIIDLKHIPRTQTHALLIKTADGNALYRMQ